MGVLTGSRTQVRIADAPGDAALLARWSAAATAVCSSRGPVFLDPAAAGRLLREAALPLVVERRGGGALAVLLARTGGYPGAFCLDYVVGDPQAWADGLGEDALRTTLGHLFRERYAHRVELVVGLFDARTVRILAGLGLGVDGGFRDYFFLDERYHPAAVFAAVRGQDWPAGADEGGGPGDLTVAQLHRARRTVEEHLRRHAPELGALLGPQER